MAAEIQYTVKKPPVFTMDTSDADRIYRVYRLIETLYPLTVAAALILGTLLPVLMILQEQKEAAILRALGWSKKLTLRRLTLEQAVLCLAGLTLAIIALFAVNGLGFLGVILVPILYVIAHFTLCVAASAAISASILQKSPMRLLQVKE
jgi:ABC-type lipoprotein release transport system permease subunit